MSRKSSSLRSEEASEEKQCGKRVKRSEDEGEPTASPAKMRKIDSKPVEKDDHSSSSSSDEEEEERDASECDENQDDEVSEEKDGDIKEKERVEIRDNEKKRKLERRIAAGPYVLVIGVSGKGISPLVAKIPRRKISEAQLAALEELSGSDPFRPVSEENDDFEYVGDTTGIVKLIGEVFNGIQANGKVRELMHGTILKQGETSCNAFFVQYDETQ